MSVVPSPTPPATFEPLDSSNGVPGDADQIAALAKRYADTAQEISDQVAHLTKLAADSTSFWKGQAAGSYHDKASDLAGRIGKAHNRYATASQALYGFAGELGEIQTTAYQAVTDAQNAKQAMTANSPDTAPKPSSPPTDAEKTAASQRTSAYSDASGSLGTARTTYSTAVSHYHDRAKYWAGVLSSELGNDPEHDSWWDRNFGWIKTLVKWIGIVVIAIVVVALIIGTCGLFAEVMVLGMSIVTLLNATAALLTAVMLVAHVGLWKSGHGSLTDVILDLVSLATFGAGMGLGKLAEGGVQAGKGVASAVSSARAGRAAFSAEGLPGFLFSVGSKSDALRSLISVLPKGADAFAGADSAVGQARAAIEALEGSSSAASRLAAFGDADLAKSVSVLSKLNQMVPGTIRLSALDGLGQGIRGFTFGTNAGVLGASGAAGAKSFTEGDDAVLSPSEQATIQQISATWSQPFSHLAPR